MEIYPYQQECLDAIESARQAGSKQALVVMATGLGKTVVSALQLKRMLAEKPGRVLYLAHQNEILRQARASYEKLLNSELTYGYFHGTEKHLHRVDVLFASFQTMYVSHQEFAPDEFMYVVVDEVHHVQAATYRPTVEYFQPDFMMGLTATPDRADEKDIRELMGDPVFHLDLFEALANEHLTAIDYRLMTDELQHLEVLETPAGKLSIAELNRTIFVPKRDEAIVQVIEEKLEQVENPRSIIFCSTVAHAELLAELMPYAQVVHSKLKKDQRERRIAAFRKGHSRVVITVDMFNEGIDIPEANVLVFLRSTASQTIYLQQLGRGLRRLEGKDQVLVLDFVANCERIEMVGALKKSVDNAIQGGVRKNSEEDEAEAASKLRDMLTLSVDGAEFDERLVDLIAVIERARQDYTKEELTEQLLAFAAQLGRSPTTDEINANKSIGSMKTFMNVFKKPLNGILRELGLPVNTVQSYSREDCTAYILDLAKKLGRSPRMKDLRSPSAQACTNTFGKPFNAILEELGLVPNLIRGYSKEEAAVELLAFAEELGRTPTQEEVNSNKLIPNADTYRRLYGMSFNDVLKELGLPLNKKFRYTAGDIDGLKHLLWAFAKELGRAPSRAEVNANKDMPNAETYVRLFGMPFGAVLYELGLTSRKKRTYTKPEITEQLLSFARDLGRAPTRREVDANREIASANACRQVFGKSLMEVYEEIGISQSRTS